MSWPWIVRIFACPKLWKQDRWEWTWQVCWLQFRTWLEATKNAVSFCFLKLHPPDRHDTKDRDVMILWHSVRPGSLLAWLSWDILWVWQSLRLDIQDLTLGINIRPQGFLTTADHHQTRVEKGFEKEPCPSERSRRTSSRSATQSECEECCNCNIITQSLESGTFLCLAAYKSFVSTAKL